METITIFLSVLILFASLFYFFSKIIPTSHRKHVAGGYQLPPGSRGWPIIGETLEYLRTAKHGVPEKFIEDRRNKYSDEVSSASSCKVFQTSLIGEPMAMLCTAEGNKFLFSNENKLVMSWWPAVSKKLFREYTDSELSNATLHNRKAIFPFLKPDSVKKQLGIIDQVTKDHFRKHWLLQDQKQVIKFHFLVKEYILTLSSKLFLDLEDPQVIALIRESIGQITAGVISLPIDFPGTNFNRAIRASRKMKKQIESLVAQRKTELMNMSMADREELENGPLDLMSSFLLEKRSEGEELTEDEICISLSAIMLASFDTSINTLCSTVIFLSQLPQVYDAVLKEQMEIAESKKEGELLNWEDVQKMKYTWNVVCEVLRLQPPVSGGFREAMSDFVYEGFLIPKGMKIHWNMHATHKNSKYFPDPHKFDPSRFEGHGPPPYSYVVFGGGPRMCPGKEHARYEMLVFLHNLITGFRWEMVYPDEKMIVDPVPFPSKGLPLYVFPRA